MSTCKTCVHWTKSAKKGSYAESSICVPLDPDTYKPMKRGFEVRLCKQPTQTFCEAPVERNGFALADGSEYMAMLATAEDFGCVRHEAATTAAPTSEARKPEGAEGYNTAFEEGSEP